MTPEEFRKHGHALIDWLADYRAGIAARPVQPATEPGEVRALLPAQPPSTPEPFASIIADLDTLVAPHLTHWQHPRFFGYFPGNADLAGVLADLVSTGLGVVGLSWQASPALTEIEEVVVDWFRQMVALPPDWVGVINDTASTSTLISLLCARERTTDYAMARDGLQDGAARLVVYASGGSHSSVEKGALLAGFGRNNVRFVPVDQNQAMRADELARLIACDLAAGLRPCAVVACVGGTAAASLDPIRAIADVCRRHGLWLHVDAAMAGAAMILPECRWMWDGIEAADTLVINAHKWIGTPFDCSLYYVRDEQHLQRVMSTNPSFLQSSVDGRVRNLRDTGIALGRRFRALKLWFLIRDQGIQGLQSRLRRDLENARALATTIAATANWRVLAPVHLQTVCVLYEPPGLGAADLDAFTKAWAEAINRSGDGYVTPAMLDGRWMVRVSIGALETEAADVAAIWDTMRRAATAELERRLGPQQ